MKLNRLFHMLLVTCVTWCSSVTAANMESYEKKACNPRSSTFSCFGESVTVNITMTIPLLSGTVPEGANVDITPFAIAPNGVIIKGVPTNIVPSNALAIPLYSLVFPKPLRGNYVIGYFMTLGAGSPVFPFNTIANFSGILLNNPVGSNTQTISFPIQTLFLATMVNPEDVMTVSANFPIFNFLE